jgi:SNF2 family DNA or RNA helicase
MLDRPGQEILADVRASALLDRLVISPREPLKARDLLSALREALPGLKLRRTAEGIALPDHDAPHLLELPLCDTLRWTPDARRFAENRARARVIHTAMQDEVRRILQGGTAAAASHLKGVGGLEILDAHQMVNVAAMTLPNSYGLCLFDEQGAGKTVSLIFALDVLFARDEIDFALIVAPKSMVPEWVQDFKNFKEDLYRVDIVSGSRREKRRVLRSRADVLVTNYETVVSMADELKATLRSHGDRAVLAVDESFFAKNLDAQRTQAVRRLREWCGRAYVLCGTPAPNRPEDLIQQFNIVDFGMTFADSSIPDDRENAGHLVQQAIDRRGVFVRHLKSDVLSDLPSRRFHRVLIPLEPEQRRLYRAALNDLILDLDSVDEGSFRRRLTSFLARRSALLQICSNPISIAKGYEEIPAKLRALDELLGQAFSDGEKVVLWSFFTASIDGILDRYQHHNPVRYDGKVSDVSERREAVRRFQEDDDAMMFVGNPAAAGVGLTLHSARLAVYESMSNQAAHYLQSLDRIHRRGQKREVEYVILLCQDTVEITEYETLVRKQRAAQQLLRDYDDEPPTQETMLAEMLAAQRLIRHSD